jgi:hypothetical protein
MMQLAYLLVPLHGALQLLKLPEMPQRRIQPVRVRLPMDYMYDE